MKREPYIVLRDFQVWFKKRASFVTALLRSKEEHVRAVDGIDLEVGKGEIYCLVGESGCGKTTTGYGILNLVEPTGGDIFVDAPHDALAAYDEARAHRDWESMEPIRAKYSMTYRRRFTWRARDVVLFIGFALAAAGIGALGGFAAYWPLHVLFGDAIAVLSAIVSGIVVGLVGTMPKSRISPRVPLVLTLAAVAAVLVTAWLALGASFSALASQREGYYYVVLFEALLSMPAAYLSAFRATGFWEGREGRTTPKARMKGMRRNLQIVFQDPYESLNPKRSVFDIVSEPLVVNRLSTSYAETEARVIQALDDAGLRPPKDFILRYPHELSGGQRQRVCIAGTLVLDPAFIVADEPVSMLDVSIRTEIVEVLLQLRDKKGLTYLFITHDLSLAAVLADRIGVMYLGKIVEEGPAQELIHNPRHPYTKALISVVPIPDPDRRRDRIILQGERPDPSDIPRGCRFHPRCPVALSTCGWDSDEVKAELLKVLAEDQQTFEAARTVTEIITLGPFKLGLITNDPASVNAYLRSRLKTLGPERPALGSVRATAVARAAVTLTLHKRAQPGLVQVAPETKVACHLYSEAPGSRVPPSTPRLDASLSPTPP